VVLAGDWMLTNRARRRWLLHRVLLVCWGESRGVRRRIQRIGDEYVGWADFDRSGRVDFGDLGFFAPNFGKSRAVGEPIVFPPNFPGAWREGSGGGEGEPWDALEDVLQMLLNEGPSVQPLDDGSDPHDALFAQIGR
jgi:hypothetical protein